ncbi:MAG: VanZ family protein [Solirubrobacterales bacterium]
MIGIDSKSSLGQVASLVAPPLAVMAVIFFLSAQPNLVPTQGFWETLARKTFHTFEYMLLALCWMRALRGLLPRWRVGAVIAGALCLTLAYAASDEFHQQFVAGRHGAPRDVAIDAIGMAIAALLALAYARRRRVGPSRPRAA